MLRGQQSCAAAECGDQMTQEIFLGWGSPLNVLNRYLRFSLQRKCPETVVKLSVDCGGLM